MGVDEKRIDKLLIGGWCLVSCYLLVQFEVFYFFYRIIVFYLVSLIQM